MRVIVDDSAFDGHIPQPTLIELLVFGFRGRHRIIVKRGPSFERWCAQFSAEAREPYDFALDVGAEMEVREPSDHEIRIGADDECVPIDKAIERLARAFLVFLENDRSDRTFLEAVASRPHRHLLQRMHSQGWLVFRSRGGISQIESLISDELAEFPGDAGRMFAVFDSDAEAPGEAHVTPLSVATHCQKQQVPYRMLARRSIENYLTRHALTVWADAQASKADVLRGRIAILYGQWFDARPERRNHFRMKEGFQKMTPAHAIYREAPEDVRKQLQQGFGTQLSTAFTSDQPREVDLRDEGAWDELSEMIEALLRSMR